MKALKSLASVAVAALSLGLSKPAAAAPYPGGFHGSAPAVHVHSFGGFHAPAGSFHSFHSFHAAPHAFAAPHSPIVHFSPGTVRTPTFAFGGHSAASADPRVTTTPRSIAGSNRVVSGWDRHRDRVWHGHRYHWNNGAWVIFNDEYYPWDDSYYIASSPDVDADADAGYNYDGDVPSDAGAPNPAPNTPAVAADPGPQEDSIAADVQQSLASRGYYDGQIDGVVGDVTREAIADFQKDNRLPVTGYITKSLLNALGL
jgi:hypothetical protein